MWRERSLKKLEYHFIIEPCCNNCFAYPMFAYNVIKNSDKETGLLDPAVRQFRASIYAVGNRYKGKNIFEVLDMTVDEAVASFGTLPEE